MSAASVPILTYTSASIDDSRCAVHLSEVSQDSRLTPDRGQQVSSHIVNGMLVLDPAVAESPMGRFNAACRILLSNPEHMDLLVWNCLRSIASQSMGSQTISRRSRSDPAIVIRATLFTVKFGWGWPHLCKIEPCDWNGCMVGMFEGVLIISARSHRHI
jgi:hypothetical protein